MKIFLFHRVHPERDPLWDPIDPKEFEKQVQYISKNYKVVLLEEFLDNGKLENNHKRIASIVFDDGYRDFGEYAFPILRKYNLPVSLYVVTDGIDHQKLIWTYQLDYQFINTSKLYLDLDGKEITWQSSIERIAFGKKLKPKLKSLAYQKRVDILRSIDIQFDDVELPRNNYHTWSELKTLINEGVFISSHTISHPMLGLIESEELIKHELFGSAQRIQEELGFFPKTISYPVGSYDERVQRIARDVGFIYGLAVDQRSFNPDSDSFFSIPRIELYNEPLWKSILREKEVIQKVKKWKKNLP